MLKKKNAVLLLVICLALGLCLCGCGSKITTSQAQQYLDGQDDTASGETEAEVDAGEENGAESDENAAEATGEGENAENAAGDGSAAAAASGNASAAAANGNNTGSSGSAGSSASGSSSGGSSSTSSGGSSSSGSSSGGSSSSAGSTTSSANQCTIAIDCKTILNNMEKLNSAKKNYVPSDGVLLKTTTVTFKQGDTVLDVLKKVTRDKGIHLDFVSNTAYGGAYVKGIGNLYEFDCGNESGWEYCVNNWYPNYGCGSYELENGDVIQWRYTCSIGTDL